MKIEDIIQETIKEISKERNISKEYVTWQNIAIRLAEKFKNKKNE